MNVTIHRMGDSDVFRLTVLNEKGTEVVQIFEGTFRRIMQEALRIENPNTNLRIRVDNRGKKD